MSSRERSSRSSVRALTIGATLFFLLGGVHVPAAAAPGKCEAPGLLDPFCEAGKTVAGKAGEVVTAPVRAVAGGAVDMITSWVADGAQWLLGKVVNFIHYSTSPDLGAEWFTERYRFMIGLAALVLAPILLIASIRAVMNQDLSQLLRSFFLYLPLAILGTFVAVFLTQALLTITDEMSAAVADGIAGDVSQIFDSVGRGLGTGGATPAAPSFAIFLGALFLIIGSFFVWLELLIRSAAVTVSVFFLPLMLSALVWPATAKWTRRLVETLVALILSKFVIVAVISLATAALADPGGGGFGAVMGGAALMLMAAFSPMALLKLMPIAEGTAMAHLEGVGRKPIQTMRPGGSVNQAVSIMRSKTSSGAGSSPQLAVAGSAGSAASGAGAVAVGVGAARAAGRAAKTPGRKLEGALGPAKPTEPHPTKKVGGAVSDSAARPTKPDTGHDK